MIDTVVGANISRLRQASGLSIADLASQCSFSLGALEAMESGTRRPSASEILSIAASLKVAISHLFTGAAEIDARKADTVSSLGATRTL
jgi:transcriptional regulator with XRE-family HTH domain